MRMNIAAALLAGTVLAALAGCSAAPEVTTTAKTTTTAAAQTVAASKEAAETTAEETAVTATSETATQTEETTTVTEAARSMTLKIGNKTVDVTWEDNASVEELKKLAASGITIKMSKYGGFEQVGSIGQAITRDDKQTRTKPGDIVLYSGDQIVMFYGSNSWRYTRLGKINLTEKELKELLGNGDVTITLSLD